MTTRKHNKGEGRDWSKPCYNARTATTRTVVITLPEEMWTLLDETAAEAGRSMREAVSETLKMALEDAVAAQKQAA